MPTEAGVTHKVGPLPFELRTDEGRIHLYLDRVADAPLGDVTVQTVVDEMESRQCIVGPETPEIIAKTIALWRSEAADPSGVLIATGRLPEHGRDGSVEWTEKCDPDRKRTADDDGNVSHYAAQLVVLQAGDVICTFHPPTCGEPGADVFNKELPARNGKPVPYSPAAGCHLDEQTGRVIADVDGTLSTAQGEIRVTEGLHLRGNVDFHTGHVTSPGDIQIDGSVVDLFQVDGGRNVAIRGEVRLAEVRAVGDLQVGGPVATGDKGVCAAGGDIRLRMVDSSTIAAWGNIEIAKEGISASLFAGKAILADHATLSGGVIAGRGGVTVKTLGSDGEVPTLVLAGIDWTIDRLTEPVLNEIERMAADLEKRLPALNTLRASLKRLTPDQREIVVELEFEAQTLQDEIEQKKAFVESVREASSRDSLAEVHVTTEIFPGVELRLTNRLAKVTKRMRGPVTFKLADIGDGLQIVSESPSGSVVGMKTGRIAKPLLKVDLPEIPPEPAEQPEAATEPAETDED